MTPTDLRLPPLVEFAPVVLDHEVLSDDEGELLWREHSKYVAVEFPSPITGGKWRLTSQGWCGYLPLSAQRGLELLPKVPVHSVWRMLDYAYFTNIQLFEDEFQAATVLELVESLARILAQRVLNLARRGLYRAYVPESGRLACLRGRLDIDRMLCEPWVPEPWCHYRRYTSDIDDNRILTWTLRAIANSGVCHDPTEQHPGGALPGVRQAYRTMAGATALQVHSERDCLARRYHRLNQEYAILHALCRFFLRFMAPGHQLHAEQGARMLPFLIPMAQLFEDYVATWLRRHLAAPWKVSRQERWDIGDSGRQFNIDLVLYDGSGRVNYALDTKYKAPIDGFPSADDIAQVIAYSVATNCREAVLVYPAPLAKPLNTIVNGIRVRSLIFPLDAEPMSAGELFLRQLDLPPSALAAHTEEEMTLGTAGLAA